MISGPPTGANVVSAQGVDLVAPGLYGGPASLITYTVVVHWPGGDTFQSGVVPMQQRIPDTIDTIAALPGTPVGINNPHGRVLEFTIPELPRMTEECL